MKDITYRRINRPCLALSLSWKICVIFIDTFRASLRRCYVIYMLLRVAHLKHLNPQAVCRRYSKGFKGLHYCQVALVEIPHNFGKNLKVKLGIYKRDLNITTHKKYS